VWQRDLALTLRNVGQILTIMGRKTEALKKFEEGRDIIFGLKQKDPSNAILLQHLERLDQEIGKIKEGK
jgi:hypothetical protein